MKISHLVLKEFVKLKASRISALTVDTSNTDVQLIIGSNGSGKSSLLHELFPFPPIKSTFSKSGYKNLTIQHHNKDYQLIFDPDHGHSFLQDRDNLNKNGNFDTQQALIEKYFNLNSNIHTILKCALPICDMAPAQRKRFIFDVNPIDIKLFVEKHKGIRKLANSYGSNLNHLYDRHKTLISQQLPEEQLEVLLSTKQKLTDQEKVLLIWITRVTDEIKQLEAVDRVSFNLETTSTTLTKLYNSLNSFFNISRASYRDKQISLPIRISMLEDEQSIIEQRLADITVSLNYYEDQKTRCLETTNKVTDELIELKQKYDTYEYPEFHPISPKSITETKSLCGEIKHELAGLFDIDTTIITQDELNELDKRRTVLQSQLYQLSVDSKTVDTKLAEIENGIKRYDTGKDCKPNNCELLKIYSDHLNEKEAKQTELSTEYKKLRKQVKSCQAELFEVESNLKQQSVIWEIIIRIKRGILNSELSIHLSDEMIDNILMTDPLQLYNKILILVEQSITHHKYIEVQERIKELTTIVDAAKSEQQLSMDLILYELKKYTTQQTDLLKDYDNKATEILVATDELAHIDLFSTLLEDLTQLKQVTNARLVYDTYKADINYLSQINKILNDLLNEVRNDLVDTTKLSREQEMLVERLDKEVDKIIEGLRPKYENTKCIEAALRELPILYIKTFINNVIRITNHFISKIATYPIVLHTYDDTPTFNLGVTINDDITLKDVSSCSDGQKAIIQLCFCLGLIVELKYTDYPIFVDELDRPLDAEHSARLIDVLNGLIADGVVSQIFLVNHHQSIFDGLFGDVIVLNGDNIVLPKTYNTNVELDYY